MKQRTIISAVLLIIICAAAATVAYKRFGPRPMAASIRIVNHAGKEMSVMVTRPNESPVRGPFDASGYFETPFVPGTQVAIYFGGKLEAEGGAWFIDALTGEIELTTNGPEVQIAGDGLVTREVPR